MKARGWALLAAGIPAAAVIMVAVYFVASSSPGRKARVAIEVADDLQAFRTAEVLRAETPGTGEAPGKQWVKSRGGSRFHSADYESPSGSLSLKAPLPGPNGEMVGYSALEPTPDEALGSARRSVKEQLKALLRFELWKEREDVASPRASRHVEAQVEKLLSAPGIEADRFEEKVRLPSSGASMHRGAVLLRIPEEWTQEATKSLHREIRAASSETASERSRRGWTVVSALFLGLVTFFLYSFLNAGSKGHLAWPLRIISIAAYLILCLGLFIVRGHLV